MRATRQVPKLLNAKRLWEMINAHRVARVLERNPGGGRHTEHSSYLNALLMLYLRNGSFCPADL